MTRAKRTSPPASQRAPGPKPAAVVEGLLQMAFHNSPAMQSVVRVSDGVLVEVNDTFLQKFGKTRGQVIGKTPFELNFWVEPEKILEYRKEMETKGRVLGYETRLRAGDGRILTVLLSSHRVEIDGELHYLTAGVDITARKEAEAKLLESERQLRESEGRFGAAFNTCPVLMTIARLDDAKFVEVNDAFVQLTGWSRAELIGHDSKQLKLWVDLEERQKFFNQLKRDHVIRDFECQTIDRHGKVHIMHLSGQIIEINREPHLITFGLDVSEQKRAEQALRESEARFSSAFRACPVLMNIARLPDGGYVEVNDAFLRWIGRDRAEVIGHAWPEFAQWENPAEQAEFFAGLERSRSARNVECRLRLHDGRRRVVLISADIIEISREPHILGFAIDITEQKKAEQALRESEAQTRALYESISAAVVVHDESGFLQINPASLKLFGTDRIEEILGKKPVDFSAPRQPNGEDSATAARRHMEQALAKGSARFEWLARRPDGTEIPVEVTLTAVQLEGRPVIQAVIIDLTERKRAEAELQNALAKERELNQLKSDFVSLVSHEFRTPLEIIMSSTDNLLRYHDRLTAPKREQLLATINKSVRRMSGMMEEVLVLGRVESGKTEFKPVSFELPACCRRICDEIQTATNGRCPVELRLKGALRSAFGDENLLRHILSNLLSNAVKYSPEGNEVTLAVAKKGSDAVLRVMDRGCGIPVADQKRLFQAFHRGSNVRQVSGTGLGLVIVRRCVALHGGNVTFESVEGKGTTFTVTLPLFGKPAIKASGDAAELNQIL